MKGVVFDCFGVLYGAGFRTLEALAPPDRMQDLVDLNRQSDYGYIDRPQYLENIAEILGKTVEEVGEISSQKYTRNLALFDYAWQLKKQGYRIGMLSNVGRDGLKGLFTEEEMTDLFDDTVLSFEEGMIKPHPHVFQLMALRLGLRPEQCIMIDDLPDNCDGARAAGLQAVLHTNNTLTIERVQAFLAE